MRNFLLIVGGLVGFYILNKGKAIQKLQFYPFGVTIEKGKLIYTMEIVNPTTSKLYFDNLFATLSSQELVIGRIQYVGRTYIPAQATTRVNFTVKVVWLDFGTWLAKVYKGEIKDIFITGTINTMGVALPFDATIPIA